MNTLSSNFQHEENQSLYAPQNSYRLFYENQLDLFAHKKEDCFVIMTKNDALFLDQVYFTQ